jgi:aminoglycoside 2'-N-acetyltransferase I
MTSDVRLRRLPTHQITESDIAALRELLWAAFATDVDGEFTEDDWQHALGGVHFVLEVGGMIQGHAAVVERELHVANMPLRTGYVEAVAITPGRQRSGLGTVVMAEVSRHVAGEYELGALGTGSQAFYERLGWQTWRGPSSVRTAHGEVPTPADDGYIMVLPTPRSPALDFDAPISCEWRAGDVW